MTVSFLPALYGLPQKSVLSFRCFFPSVLQTQGVYQAEVLLLKGCLFFLYININKKMQLAGNELSNFNEIN